MDSSRSTTVCSLSQIVAVTAQFSVTVEFPRFVPLVEIFYDGRSIFFLERFAHFFSLYDIFLT